jgi:hypothetical protein
MRWLWFVLSVALFAVAFRTHSMGLAALCLLLGLGFLLMGTLALASSRIESAGRDAAAMLAPDELRRMREEIERRKAAAGGEAVPDAGATARRREDDEPGVPG